MIEIQTTEASNKVHKWRLYWFHETDLDANYPADAKTLADALIANPQLRAAVLDALGHRELAEMVAKWRACDGCSCICGGTCGCPCHDDEPGIDERRAALQGSK